MLVFLQTVQNRPFAAKERHNMLRMSITDLI
jgi:hypothetical protein